jgi:hypothetical protein
MLRSKNIVTPFESEPEVEKAIEKLKEAGVTGKQIHIIKKEENRHEIDMPYAERNYIWQGIFVGVMCGALALGFIGFLIDSIILASDGVSFLPDYTINGIFLGGILGAIGGGMIGGSYKNNGEDEMMRRLKDGAMLLIVRPRNGAQVRIIRDIMAKSEARSVTA